jgi:membrane protein
MMAAALSFYGVLSLVPLLTLGLTLMVLFVGGSDGTHEKLNRTISDYFPVSGSLVYEAILSIQRQSGLLGGLSLIGLLFTASALFASLEIAFNAIWEAQSKRNWLHQRMRAVAVTLLTLLLLFLSIGTTSLMTYALKMPQLFGSIGLWQQIPGHLLSGLFSVLMFTLLYRLIPECPISYRHALRGGAAAGIAWEAAKLLFTFYLSNFGAYDRVYGSLGGIVILLVWCYYSAKILLLGAEIAADSRRAVIERS